MRFPGSLYSVQRDDKNERRELGKMSARPLCCAESELSHAAVYAICHKPMCALHNAETRQQHSVPNLNVPAWGFYV